jgi:hypothetical protein
VIALLNGKGQEFDSPTPVFSPRICLHILDQPKSKGDASERARISVH